MEKKKFPTQRGAKLGSILVYRDDLEEVIAILNEYCKQVIIEDNEYIFDSLDELLEKRGPYPKQLSINSREPLVIFNVRIKPRYTTIGTSGDGDNLLPYARVKELLGSRRRKWLDLFYSLGLFFIPIFLMYAWGAITKKLGTTGPWFWLTTFVIAGIGIWLIFSQTLWGQGAFTKISLKRKHEEASFWTRNKDTILVAIIAAFIGGLITWMVTYVTR